MYQDYTDLVEPFGIDESWLDVSGTLHLFGGDPVALADEIRRRMRQEFGLTISVGVSFNKIFAKLGSDYKKPDATTWISRDNYQRLVWPLPVTDLLYVGRSAAETLERVGVRTIGDLARRDSTRPPSRWATATPLPTICRAGRRFRRGSFSWPIRWGPACGGTA